MISRALRYRLAASALAGSAALLAPMSAHGQTAYLDMLASGMLHSYFTGNGPVGIANLAIAVTQRVSVLFYGIGVAVIVRAGLKLINSQEDDKLDSARRTIVSALVAMMLIALAPRIVDAVYGGIGLCSPASVGGSVIESCAAGGAGILNEEIGGVLRWIMVLVIPISFLMIVVSCLQAVGSFGSEDGPKKIRQAVFGVIGGLLLFVVREAAMITLGVDSANPNPMPIVVRALGIVSNVLELLGIVAVAMVIYAGTLTVLNFGNEEAFSRARTIIGRVLLGLFVIIVSYMIVQLATSLVSG